MMKQPGAAVFDKTDGAQAIAIAGRVATSPVQRAEEDLATLVAEYRFRKSNLVMAVYAELSEKRAAGEAIDLEALCTQFPSIQKSVERAIQLHSFLEENPSLVDARPPSNGSESLGSLFRWPVAGDTFLGFELLRELGRGAFARVFLARQPSLGDRRVAVKIAESGASEARILGRVQHPNIVPVYSVEEDPVTRLTAVCMPYVGDTTLCDVLDKVLFEAAPPSRALEQGDTDQDTPPNVARTPRGTKVAPWLQNGTYVDGMRQIALQLAEALEHIHERGIFHRDLKPSNVLMSRDGVPMLLDFNLSTDPEEATKRMGGTPSYMSPEQLLAMCEAKKSKAAPYDARSDIFSFGVIFFELLTGRHPFGPLPRNCKPSELLMYLRLRQEEGPAPAVCELNPGVDRAFGGVIQRCLLRDPNERPQTAAEVVAALRKGLAPRARATRWIGRRPAFVFFAIALFIGATLGVSALSLRPSKSEQAFQRGVAYYGESRFPEAIEHFTQALQDDPALKQVYFARGRAYLQMGLRDKRYYNLAYTDLVAADDLVPSGRTKASLGYCMHRRGMDAAAAHSYEQALERGFDNAQIQNNLGFACMSYEPDKAFMHFANSMARNPRLQAPYHNRGFGSLEKARAKLSRLDATATQAGRIDAAKRLMHDTVSALQAAMEDLRVACEIGPASVELFYDTGCVYATAARVDPEWGVPAVSFLAKSITLGLNPQPLRSSAATMFLAVKDDVEFGRLLKAPRPESPRTQTLRMVDPLEGLFE